MAVFGDPEFFVWPRLVIGPYVLNQIGDLQKMQQNRQKEIVKLLEENGTVQTEELVQAFGASESTIRRDLIILQNEGLLIRTFGGAQLPVSQSLVAKTFDEKVRLMKEQKDAIGKRAGEMVESGMVIVLDGGTTLWSAFAVLKKKRPLTILTSALSVIEQLGAADGITVHSSGGRFRPKDLDFVGPGAVEMYSHVRADIALLGTDNYIPGTGAFADSEEAASTTRAMAGCADKKILVLDHTKLANRGCYKLLSSSDIDCIVTDSNVDHEIKVKLEQEPSELIVVDV